MSSTPGTAPHRSTSTDPDMLVLGPPAGRPGSPPPQDDRPAWAGPRRRRSGSWAGFLLAGLVGASGMAILMSINGVGGGPLHATQGIGVEEDPLTVPTPSESASTPTLAPRVHAVAERGGSAGAAAYGTLCHPDELDLAVTTPVPGGHDVTTTLTVTNTGERSCQVEGWPSVRVLSGGEDLALFVHVATVDPVRGEHVEATPITLEPGERAGTQVWWRSWGAAADLRTQQQLRIGIGGGEEVLDLREQDRWDVVRSAEAWVAPWQAASDDR
ncbi:DUF4232 domain-containing protein [Ornithinimicrobium sp. Y1694]|uniref:DUF4232 domain-containing protein n=1 Tax=Ornithinimicrobium sp. Y1694 TaxID=3418590 RepID=UPI003CF79818